MSVRDIPSALANCSKRALIGSLMVYNHPQFDYREESFVVLYMNAWELLLKAIWYKEDPEMLEKARLLAGSKAISRKQAQEHSWEQALNFVQRQPLPDGVNGQSLDAIVRVLTGYRNQAVHFLIDGERPVAELYQLAQAGILIFVKLLKHFFTIDLSEEINWALLPLGVNLPTKPVESLSSEYQISPDSQSSTRARLFRMEIQEMLGHLGSAQAGNGADHILIQFVGRLVKPKGSADDPTKLVRRDDGNAHAVVVEVSDPNSKTPLRRKDVLTRVNAKREVRITPYHILAVLWKYDLANDETYYWRSDVTGSAQYSQKMVDKIVSMDQSEIEQARKEYSANRRKVRLKKKKKKVEGR